ncbi:tryptophan-rich sensory protein [Candidatus Babeliales bacterium]|nr:tryptophan-rich sensory protein [Candidatus Babeliales bacterium]
MKQYFKTYRTELIGSIICLSFGILSGYFSHAGNTLWYQNLLKPTFNPPSWIFSPIWTVLYLMIGAAGVQLWNVRKRYPQVFNLFFIQIILNYAWSPLFFYFHNIRLALAVLISLWCVTFTLIYQLKKQKQATPFMLFIPYFAWISFALLLNFNIVQLNPHL